MMTGNSGGEISTSQPPPSSFEYQRRIREWHQEEDEYLIKFFEDGAGAFVVSALMFIGWWWLRVMLHVLALMFIGWWWLQLIHVYGMQRETEYTVTQAISTQDPVEVSGLPKDIVKISAGYYHSSAITESGELYMWGKISSGQLGLGRKASKVIPVPSKVDFLNGVPIKMGRWLLWVLTTLLLLQTRVRGIKLGWRRIRKAWSWTQSEPLGIFEF